jgi:hypothetical protein
MIQQFGISFKEKSDSLKRGQPGLFCAKKAPWSHGLPTVLIAR